MPPPTALPAWQKLADHRKHGAPVDMRTAFAAAGPQQSRFQEFSVRFETGQPLGVRLLLDYSKNLVGTDTMRLLMDVWLSGRVCCRRVCMCMTV